MELFVSPALAVSVSLLTAHLAHVVVNICPYFLLQRNLVIMCDHTYKNTTSSAHTLDCLLGSGPILVLFSLFTNINQFKTKRQENPLMVKNESLRGNVFVQINCFR